LPAKHAKNAKKSEKCFCSFLFFRAVSRFSRAKNKSDLLIRDFSNGFKTRRAVTRNDSPMAFTVFSNNGCKRYNFFAMNRLIFSLSVILLFAVGVSAQTVKPKPLSTPPQPAAVNPVKSSPAYAEVLLRKTELEAGLEDLLVEYTEEYPKVKETRHELGLVKKQLERLVAVNPNDAGKLTLALGKLIVRKAELDTNLHFLLQQYNEQHEDVKRARRKSETFEKAIREILP
jgi:hypothetical protein